MRAQRTLLAALALVLAPGYALAQSTAPVGSQPLSSQTASKFFHGVGLSAALGFGHATATLAASGPAADPATGPFFYPDLNLSFQVAAGRCSMVSASDAAATEMATAFADATALEFGPDAVIPLTRPPAAPSSSDPPAPA